MENTNSATYVDSKIFLAAALYTNSEGEAARQLVLKHQLLSTSAFTFTELLRVVARISGKSQAVWMCKQFSTSPNIQILPYDLQTANAALELFKTSNLDLRQAIHLATMQVNGITQIASLDPTFDEIKGIKRAKL